MFYITTYLKLTINFPMYFMVYVQWRADLPYHFKSLLLKHSNNIKLI